MLISTWPSLVSVVLILNICILPSKTQDVYTLCDVSRPNVVNINAYSSPVVIHSPNYGIGEYSNDQHCSVVFRSGSEPLVLSFSYNYFQLESNSICGYDSLCIHGVKFCGYWLAGRTFHYILPEYSDLTLDFKTDYSVTLPGFEILVTPEFARSQTIQEVSGGVGSSEGSIYNYTVTYYPGFNYTDRCTKLQETSYAPFFTSTIEPTTAINYTVSIAETTIQIDHYAQDNVYYFCGNSSSNIVNINATSRPVLIESLNNGGGTYDNNQYCSLVIRSGEDPLILFLHYNSFSLEYHSICYWDSLCVHGVNFCGDWETGQKYAYILPENSSFTLVFKSDHIVTLPGFQINVTTVLASNQTIEEVTGGIGSDISNIYNRTVTYQAGFPYTDRCVNQPVSKTTSTTPLQDYTTTVTTSSPDSKAQDNVYYFCGNSSSNIVNINATSPPVLIQSPNYGAGPYDNNQYCSLVIRSGEDPLILFLHYNSFSLEYHSICSWDSLCVHGIKFCGDWETGQKYTYILPENSSFTLVFKSDYSVTLPGFQINVTTELASNQTIEEVTGGIGSDISNNYNTTVTYQPGFSYTDRCGNQPVYNTTSTTPLEDYTVTTLPTDINKTKTVYHFCDNSTSNIVNINAASPPILIQSPNFGNGTYDNNQYCSLIIKSGRDPLILSFFYSSYDLENVWDCIYDWLCVHGLKFCGNWETGHTFEYILPENSFFTLVFKTDASVLHPGFQIQVSQELATNQIVAEATGGDGSHDYSVVYSNVTYYPWYRDGYKDRCSPEANPTGYPPESNTTITDAPVTTETSIPTCSTTNVSFNVDEVDAALVQAINSLNRARALLRQQN